MFTFKEIQACVGCMRKEEEKRSKIIATVTEIPASLKREMKVGALGET